MRCPECTENLCQIDPQNSPNIFKCTKCDEIWTILTFKQSLEIAKILDTAIGSDKLYEIANDTIKKIGSSNI